MTDIFVILILCVLLGYKDYQARKERKELINALIARNATELGNLTVAEKVKPQIAKNDEELNPDLIPVGDLTDEEFEKYIEDAGK